MEARAFDVEHSGQMPQLFLGLLPPGDVLKDDDRAADLAGRIALGLRGVKHHPLGSFRVSDQDLDVGYRLAALDGLCQGKIASRKERAISAVKGAATIRTIDRSCDHPSE